MSSIHTVAQTSNPGEIVSLYRLDATSVGGTIYYFCEASVESGVVSFGGQVYTPVDVEITDMQTTGNGSLPTPHIKIANTNGVFQNIVNTYGDLLGCELRRVRTFRRFLDDGPDADPLSFYGPDVFRVERKVNENAIFIEWELSAAIDQEGKMLPGRQVIRDTCLWRYRIWDAARNDFDYSKAQCPYTGSNYYDLNNQPTTADKDVPSRNITCCKLRFGANNPLPFGGFPGVARVRQ